MLTEVIFPRVDMDMAAGRVSRWLTTEGSLVARGDPLFEIETDKAAMEIEAPASGTLRGVCVAEGDEVAVGAPVAWIVPDGEVWQQHVGKEPKPTLRQQEDDKSDAVADEVLVAVPAAIQTASLLRATPLARHEAKRRNLDLSTIKGSGPRGRIQVADLQQAAKPIEAPVVATPVPPPASPRPASAPIAAPHQKIPNSNMRRVIARRLSESKQFVPHFYVSIDVELDRLLALRGELNASAPKEGPGQFKLSVNDLLVKAAAVTLRRVPRVNASYTDEAIILYDDVDISIAVSIPDGLITPIIRQADARSLSQLSNGAKALIARAREGKLKPEEFQGGSFSISNMGMYGVRDFSAILNPPQGAILAIGAGDKRAVVRAGDRIEVATVMTCTLSVDHRVIDGALAAQWMSVFKSVVESPMSLVV